MYIVTIAVCSSTFDLFKWLVSGSSNIKVKDEKTGTVHLVGSHYISSGSPLKSQWSFIFLLVTMLLHTLVSCDAITKRDLWYNKLRINWNIDRYREIICESSLQNTLLICASKWFLWKQGRLKFCVWWFSLGYIFLPKMSPKKCEGFDTEFEIKCIW